MTVSSPREGTEGDLVTRLSLLVGQGFFFGLMVGLVVISAFALLMSAYGPGALPWVYIAVAILGSLAFYGFAEAQRRWSLVQVSLVTEVVVVAFLASAWAGLVFAQADWLAFAAMVVYSLLLQIGFVILGGQAGKLLDVRQIKRYFPRIVAGFVVGFIVAGGAATPLQRWLGGAEQLLLVAAIAAGVMLLMLARDQRTLPRNSCPHQRSRPAEEAALLAQGAGETLRPAHLRLPDALRHGDAAPGVHGDGGGRRALHRQRGAGKFLRRIFARAQPGRPALSCAGSRFPAQPVWAQVWADLQSRRRARPSGCHRGERRCRRAADPALLRAGAPDPDRGPHLHRRHDARHRSTPRTRRCPRTSASPCRPASKAWACRWPWA